MTRAVLTQEQVAAAIAAGADATILATQNAEALAANAALALLAPEQTAEAEAAKVVADAAAAEAAATAEAAALAAAEAAKTAPTAEAIEIGVLTKQLAELNATVVDLKVAAQSAEAKFKVDTGSLEALRKIAADSINKMTVALGGTATATDTLSAEAVVARHAETSATFFEKFKVGGVAITTITEADEKPKKTNVSSIDQARVKATKTGGNK